MRSRTSLHILLSICSLVLTMQVHARPKNILITAFGPYGGMDKNPAQMILNEMRNMELNPKKFNFTFKDLRVAYGDVDQFIGSTDFSQFDLIFMMGLRPDSKRILIENVGMNLADENKDIDSVARPGIIIKKAPNRIRLDEKYINKITKYVKRKKQPFAFSEYAGNYVCNYLIYLMRYTVQQIDTDKPVIFFHVANSIDYNSAPRNEEQASYIMGLIKHLAKFY